MKLHMTFRLIKDHKAPAFTEPVTVTLDIHPAELASLQQADRYCQELFFNEGLGRLDGEVQLELEAGDQERLDALELGDLPTSLKELAAMKIARANGQERLIQQLEQLRLAAPPSVICVIRDFNDPGLEAKLRDALAWILANAEISDRNVLLLVPRKPEEYTLDHAVRLV